MKSHIRLIIKSAINFIFAVIILVLNKTILDHIHYFVAGVLFLDSIESLIVTLLLGEAFNGHSDFARDITTIIVGVLIILVQDNPEWIYIIWGIWAIINEGFEFNDHVIGRWKKSKGLALFNLAESVIIIVFSILLVMNPQESHALNHLYLLAAELTLKAIFTFEDEIVIFSREKKAKIENFNKEKKAEIEEFIKNHSKEE